MGFWVYVDHLSGGGGGGGGNDWLGCLLGIVGLLVFGFLVWLFGLRLLLLFLVIGIGIYGGFIGEGFNPAFLGGYLAVIAFVWIGMNFGFRGALATAMIIVVCVGGIMNVFSADNVVKMVLWGALCLFLFVSIFPYFFNLVIKPLFHLA